MNLRNVLSALAVAAECFELAEMHQMQSELQSGSISDFVKLQPTSKYCILPCQQNV